MSVVSCLTVDIVKTNVGGGAITFDPGLTLTRLTSLENSDLGLNTVGPKFVNDVGQVGDRVHVVVGVLH